MKNLTLYELAAKTGNKITKVHKKGKIYYCKLNGETTKCVDARSKLIEELKTK